MSASLRHPRSSALPPGPSQSASAGSSVACATAFSLVEVLLALGIVSFALIGLMSLLPVGLKTFHQADMTTTETQIAQTLVNRLQLSGFTNALGGGNASYYFTSEGQPTADRGGQNTLYTVTVTAATNVALPGAAGGSHSANILSLLFSITCKTAPQTTNVIPAYISNNGS
ncbi:Verru_Chthon cassette protein B [Verrucomicrobium sp. GAS474]|uniref:Verru_Chthon cassette protein B n=1 Tax=Verrucomicrobium sp. GAS474 TaxID=1882831 RepID=UPI00087D6B8E|nr:Verru_Chthon cassette protein B [Verrucomicrobium sp. GAS474]SDU29342.1 Verru_Chthon cassette protein B [Verrucomicrobium sp. GAS474]